MLEHKLAFLYWVAITAHNMGTGLIAISVTATVIMLSTLWQNKES